MLSYVKVNPAVQNVVEFCCSRVVFHRVNIHVPYKKEIKMLREFKIKKVVKTEEKSGPFILTINDNNQMIGDMARALVGYIKIGLEVTAKGHYIGEDFIIETLRPKCRMRGSQVDTYVTIETIKPKTKSQIRVYA
jgi:hypothetical protein